MSINLSTCPNRIKPKLLREQKTEALLVFIRTTLEQSFQQIEEKNYQLEIGTKKDNELIYSNLKQLLINLQDCVVNSSYLRSLIANAAKNKSLQIIAKKEEPLMTYYDSIVKAIESKLRKGTPWIPELVVISLLSEWVLEEERSVFLYPFLKDIDYIGLIDRYDKTKQDTNNEEKEIIMNMYKISSFLINKLKNSTYKSNSHRKPKKRKR